MENYVYSRCAPGTEEFTLRVNGEEVFIFAASMGYIAAVSGNKFEVLIETTRQIRSVEVRPLSKAVQPRFTEHTVRFTVNRPMNLQVDVNGQTMPLYLFFSPPEMSVPDQNDDSVIFFEGGRVYDAGEIVLNSGQTLYIAGGAVVRGTVRAVGGTDIRVCGRGILDGRFEYGEGDDRLRKYFVVFEGCRNCRVEDVILADSPCWNLVFGACEHCTVSGVREVSKNVSSDGVDIVGSKNIIIDGVFFRNNDDCIAVKSFDNTVNKHNATLPWNGDVENITVQNSTFYSSEENAGNCLEIGFELRCRSVKGIRFINCDVIAVHGFGGVFTIHLGDCANIEDVLYEDIRVEHFFDRLVDLRIVHSPKWNENGIKGSIKNVKFRNIRCRLQDFNPGYSHSLVCGFGKSSVQDVEFESFYIGDTKVMCDDDLWLSVRKAKNITYR